MNSNQTNWIFIPGFDEHYKLYKDGKVVSLHNNVETELKPFIANGYYSVALSLSGTKRVHPIHKLVATAFLPNPKGLTQVLFKEDDISKFNAENLEWGTRSELLFRRKGGQFNKKNKFTEDNELPERANISSSSMVLSDTKLVKKTENRIDKEYRTLALKKKKVKSKYESQRNKLYNETTLKKETIKNSTALNKEAKLREIETAYTFKLNRINKRERDQLFVFSKEVVAGSQVKLETNRYFKYKGEFNKITDTGDSLIIRVKGDDKWDTIPVAKIILEDMMGQPKPGKGYFVGYKDFDYRNISDLNLIWETGPQKHARYYALMPVSKITKISKVKDSNTYNINPLKEKEILTFLEKGNSIRVVARKIGIPFWTVYRYCKEKGLVSNSPPSKLDEIKSLHEEIVERLKSGKSKQSIVDEFEFSRTMFYKYCEDMGI